ncbi:MAG: hypothetical protein K5891_10335 [Lachnospiraceae bacterium]|nr:hypothetical protein [Lachnospiraceae bacterium]
MGCFLVPTTEAVIVTIAEHVAEKKALSSGNREEALKEVQAPKVPFTRKLSWLRNMLWGGSGLLAFEHVWHGEVVPWFPFLTAASDPADAAEMLHEMSTVGVTMAALVTVVWLGMVAVSSAVEKKAAQQTAEEAESKA